jgi:hypothetical protein
MDISKITASRIDSSSVKNATTPILLKSDYLNPPNLIQVLLGVCLVVLLDVMT